MKINFEYGEGQGGVPPSGDEETTPKSAQIPILGSSRWWQIRGDFYKSLLDSILLDGIFLIHSAHVCLLIGNFNTFTFNVITDKEGLTSAILLFFSVSHIFFVPHIFNY